MTKYLTKTGNSLALVLDRPILEATKINASTKLEISTDGDVIVVTPVRNSERIEKMRSGVESIHERYTGVFKRLAE